MHIPIRTLAIFIAYGIFTLPVALYAIPITKAQARACALQADGNVIAAGIAVSNGTVQCTTVRYVGTSGGLDTAFGTNGVVTTLIGSRCELQAVAIQPSDNKIVVAGFADTQALLIRYNTDGSLDTSFGTNGSVTTSIGTKAISYGLALQSDGSIVVAGSTVQSGTGTFFVARYTATGTLDTTFNSSGIVTTSIGSTAYACTLALQTDGKIVVAGTALVNGSHQYALARYNTDGSLDTSFGTAGIITTAIGTWAQGTSVALQSDNTIVVGGFSDTNSALVRYTSTGAVDTTYGTNGIVTTAIGNNARIHAITIDTSNNVIATGFSDNQLTLARYTPTGSLDTTWSTFSSGTNPIILIERLNAPDFPMYRAMWNLPSSTSTMGNAITLQPDGSLVVIGHTSDNFLAIRFTGSGTADSSWQSTGIPIQSLTPFITTLTEQQSVGTNGGTFTAGSWQTRTLNTITPSNTDITVANNQFTLLPGIYSITIKAPAYKVGSHQARLQNITDNLTQFWGSNDFSSNTGSVTSSVIEGTLLVSRTTTFEVQHICANTQASDGFGIAAGFGATELYTTVKIHP